MSETFAITASDVVKSYKVRHQKGRTLKEAFLRQRIYSETINALNHVSFDVPRGSTMGLIGSNGSGKSTMLKLIAGTSKPNQGEVKVSGRVSALLELGAGFHPDFTGRENVYLDGIIMGLSRREIDERFDEIVDFAEMEEFIDAPTKTYSSGMYMRLAFSVAVSVEPDILLIDEVLAVGDESFQRKCLGRINEFKSQDKTILFVSHSMNAVRELCSEAVWLHKGNLKAQGETERVIDQYLSSVNQQDEDRLSAERRFEEDESRWGTGRAEITGFELFDDLGNERHVFDSGGYLKVRVHYRANEPLEKPVVGLMIKRSDGTVCYGNNTLILGDPPLHMPEEGVAELEFEKLTLLPGSYTFTAALQSPIKDETFDYHESLYPFEVVGEKAHETGVIRIPYRWLDWPGNK